MHHNQGPNLQLRYVPWPGIEPIIFWCPGRHSKQLSHPARVRQQLFPLLVGHLVFASMSSNKVLISPCLDVHSETLMAAFPAWNPKSLLSSLIPSTHFLPSPTPRWVGQHFGWVSVQYLSGLNCLPPKFIYLSPPVSQNVTLFGNRVIPDVIQMRYLGWALMHND